MIHRFPWMVCALILGAMNSVFAAEREPVSFNLHVRPILSDRCWACHGPDENKRKAKLRLDTKEGALAEKDGKYIIKPGEPEKSELFKRLISSDPDEVMPPPDSHLTVSKAEVEVIRQWISEGANWEKHWAYIAPRKRSVEGLIAEAGKLEKEFRDGKGDSKERAILPAQNEIDRFIRARLAKEGLTASPEASREKLIRRLAFDLTGLPPTLEQIDAFVADKSSNAYEKVVDALLKSEAFGERMAVDWLDLSRYSDTFGYQADRYRAMWPWRDWVIKAFNENMPYDRFVTWQLAGDLLPNPSKEQILATAFNRHHMQTEEGGSVEEEFRVSYVVDRVNTMGTAFLAQTFECSRCHDHKYDPISQKDFYSLYSFFNNIDESGQTSHFTDSMPVPTLLLSDDAMDRRLAELSRTIAEKEQQAAAVKRNARGAFDAWRKENGAAQASPSGLVADIRFEEIKDNKVANAAPNAAGKTANAVEGPQIVEGRSGKGFLLNGENGVTLNEVGAFSRVDPFTIGIWIRTPAHAKRAVILHRSQAALDAASRGYEMVLEEGRVSLGLHHMWPGNAIKVRSSVTLPTNEWVQLVMSYDGSSRAEGLKLYVNGELTTTEVIRDNLWKEITYERANPPLTVGYRFRDNGFRDGMVDELKVFNRELTVFEVRQLHSGGELSEGLAKGSDEFFDYYLANYNPIFQKHLRDLREVRAERSRLINPIPEVMVMHEMAEERPAYLLKRGAYDAPGERVSMTTPASIFPFGPELPRNRLGLAKWMFAQENPLTARVAANRLWQMMFGRGIVATADNFGSQGELPTHPELLDWLAVDFREGGWNVKAFLKQIAMSATYRQSSDGNKDAIAKDPENRLLAGGPVYRLSAEQLRDQALAASRLLVRKVGGEPVKPYQPEGLWEEKSGARYERDKGDGLYRRSLYTFWKRTSPPPSMIAFDSAERNVCIVTRQVTSTPLQSLVLLNDPQLTEASRFLAQRMFKEGGSTLQSQVAYLFRLLTSRAASPKELELLLRMFNEQKEIFGRDQQETLQLLTVGDKLNDPEIPPVDLAAGTVLASALLNFDETIMKR